MTPGLFAVGMALAAGSPRLQGPSAPVGETEPVVLELSGNGSLLIDSCAPVELERRDGKTWIAVATVPCERSQPATLVSGPLTLTVPAPPPGEYRGVVAWGSTCADKLPFHLAACKKLGVARSEAFTVGVPPAVEPVSDVPPAAAGGSPTPAKSAP